MAFKKLSIKGIGPASGAEPASSPDIWVIFRALRDARSVFGLRAGHLQTLQAMLSFLKPGQGETVFASNASICERIGGIDERTLRRHINRFVELGFLERNDSTNRKRYRLRASDGACISYGLSATPLLSRARELLSLAQEVENARRDRVFLRKQILTKLALLEEAEASSAFVSEARKLLRRKLTVPQYRHLLRDTDAECLAMSTVVDAPKTMKLPANDGQNARDLSKSVKEKKDIEEKPACKTPNPRLLTSVCDQATAFSAEPLRNWHDIEKHASSLAPMMGIHRHSFETAKTAIGARDASCAIFILLQLGPRIKNFAAYFHAVTLGKRREQFDPVALLKRLSQSQGALA